MKKCILLISILMYSIQAQDDTTGISTQLTPPPAPLPHQEILTTGSLHIIAPASDATIYLDGKQVGTGECTVNDIPIGRHVVFIQDGKREHILEAYTVEGITRTIKVKPDRKTFVNVMSTFSNTWCHGVRAYGPSLDIGIQHKDSYFGLNFHWAFFNDWYWGNSNSNGEGFMLGGALLQWYYTVYTYKDIFEIAPGLASGFWYFDGEAYPSNFNPESSYDYEDIDYFEEMFFTGPSLRLSAGYKRVFFSCAYTMLIGTNVGHSLAVGTRVVL